MNKTIIWGHRGTGFKGTQNTFSSFKNAIDMGVDGIKTETKLSKEGEIVLSYFNTLKINGEDVPIQELTIEEIKKFKLENNELIPTLREVFEAFKSSNTKYNFDIANPKEGIQIVKTAKEYELLDHIELAKPSTRPDSLSNFFTEIRNFDRNVMLVNSVFLKHSVIEDKHLELDDMRKLNITGINVNYNYANFDLFKRVKDHGFKFCVWGVLFKRSMKRFLTMNYNGEYIDALMSNQPDRLVKFRNEFQN
ncbi:MAG: glycerophosphodiester phosphodiesterase [Promethearchaeota archaeon]|jgi:glycerophosphoryl diester phosphodiesterase